MTQAYNLAILANAVNTSGQLNVGTNATGTLPVANGGTGQSALTANNVVLGNGTSGVQFVAPGANGNILTSNGTTWTSATPSGGGVTSLNGQTGAITNTTLGAIGSYIIGAPNGVSTSASLNTTIAGSSLRYRSDNFNAYSDFGSGVSSSLGVSGTWRSMGRSLNSTADKSGSYFLRPNLWVRIS